MNASLPTPETMNFVECPTPGRPDVLRLATMAVPTPRSAEVLIKVAAAGVNRPDVAQRQGKYPPPPGASSVLGLEVAGTVVGCGSAVRHLRTGDRVTALVNGGGYAEYCVAPEGQCLPWPRGYDAVRAAALPETYFTVWANLFQHGALKAGERALVHGGTSGIGLTALQLGAAFGATMYATAGSDQKCRACVDYGAAGAYNYRTTDFSIEIDRVTESRGVDVVLDMVGAPYFKRNLRLLSRDGRLVSIAFLEGAVVSDLDLSTIMMKRLIVTGSTMRPRTAEDKGRIATELRTHVWPMLDRGRCGPVVHATFPLDKVAAAHELMESSTHIGKIVLVVAE